MSDGESEAVVYQSDEMRDRLLQRKAARSSLTAATGATAATATVPSTPATVAAASAPLSHTRPKVLRLRFD